MKCTVTDWVTQRRRGSLNGVEKGLSSPHGGLLAPGEVTSCLFSRGTLRLLTCERTVGKPGSSPTHTLRSMRLTPPPQKAFYLCSQQQPAAALRDIQAPFISLVRAKTRRDVRNFSDSSPGTAAARIWKNVRAIKSSNIALKEFYFFIRKLLVIFRTGN